MEATLPDEKNQRTSFNSNRRLPPDPCCHSLLPFLWKIMHNSRWMAQVVASALSLVAFILLLVMVFSKNWLCPSGSRFYQRFPTNISHIIHTWVHTMSMGLLHSCKSRDCFNTDGEKDSLKLWINHLVFVVAKISFILTLGLGLILTIWLHLPYLPHLQKLPSFGLIGTILSFCEVTFMFFTLLLFPINLWIFELKGNLSIPIGWSYFIGWLVFILYVICAHLCYLNHKTFCSPILDSSSGPTSCHTGASSVPQSLTESTLLDTSTS